MAGPGYTVKDLFFYIGLFGGIIATYLLLEPAGMHRFLRLIIGLAVGFAFGWGMLKVYEAATTPSSDDDLDKPG